MSGQVDRCDRTAYVSGLHTNVSDIELFEVFNRVAHVEKVIVRNGTTRHAIVVFKSVHGLYMALVHFQGYLLNGRTLHIRTLRESSHATSETISSMVEIAKHHTRRPASVQERIIPSPSFNHPHDNRNSNYRGYRNSSGSYGRRRNGNQRNYYPNDSYSSGQMYDGQMRPYYGFNPDHIHFEDYSEGAKRFDGLANLIRASTPTDPFAPRKRNDSNNGSKNDARSRANSAKDQPISKNTPPTWKMELQIKKNENCDPRYEQNASSKSVVHKKLTPLELIMQPSPTPMNDNIMKKKRPNLSVINPSLFYEQNPRTSSPVTFANQVADMPDKIASPRDPAVLAYSRHRAPPTAFAGLSPIDTNNCSFITTHLGTVNEHVSNISPKREMTNDELSDMIVSTGNLRIDIQPSASDQSIGGISSINEPAPWSPVKRLRGESGSVLMSQFGSPQFSPIAPKLSEFNETEDDVFSSMEQQKNGPFGSMDVKMKNTTPFRVNNEQKLSNYEDINNSRLPSNSHSANPNTEKREFVFPDSPMCRHSSVPSLAHLVNDFSDFGPLSSHVTLCAKFNVDQSSVFHENQSTSDGKSLGCSSPIKKTSVDENGKSEHTDLMMAGF